MSFRATTAVEYSSYQDGSEFVYDLEVAEQLEISFLHRAGVNVDAVISIPDFISGIKNVVGSKLLRSIPQYKSFIFLFDDVVVSFPVQKNQFETIKRTIKLRIYGEIERVQELHDKFKNLYPHSRKGRVDWFYANNNRSNFQSIALDHPYSPHNEFFPWIKPDIETFQKDFLDSSANILLFIGQAGTGKTSFIRDLIFRHDLAVAVTYDENLMQLDSFFIDFLNGSRDLLVIEDADIILKAREDGNKIMNKLLNASDGLIPTKKKMIFTANLTHLDQVDEALLRPGRCFSALRFRELALPEAQAAAKAVGLPEPDRPKTLSELFSDKPAVISPSRFGFSLS